jgi:hypothetical protein
MGIAFERRISSMKSFKQSATYFQVEEPEDRRKCGYSRWVSFVPRISRGSPKEAT